MNEQAIHFYLGGFTRRSPTKAKIITSQKLDYTMYKKGNYIQFKCREISVKLDVTKLGKDLLPTQNDLDSITQTWESTPRYMFTFSVWMADISSSSLWSYSKPNDFSFLSKLWIALSTRCFSICAFISFISCSIHIVGKKPGSLRGLLILCCCKHRAKW